MDLKVFNTKQLSKIKLPLCREINVQGEECSCHKPDLPWLTKATSCSHSHTAGLNSCTCIQGSEPFSSLVHSSDFHWNRLPHCRFSMNINFSDLTCCFRTRFHSTVDFHMCCNVCVSKQCLGNHIRVAERRKRKACFLIFFCWRSRLETQSERRSSIFPRRNTAHRANMLLTHTKNVLVAYIYFRKKKKYTSLGLSWEKKNIWFADIWEAQKNIFSCGKYQQVLSRDVSFFLRDRVVPHKQTWHIFLNFAYFVECLTN